MSYGTQGAIGGANTQGAEGERVGVYRVECSACRTVPRSQAIHCHECKGLRFIERVVLPKDCTGEQPECPVYSDPMVGGWECRRCGRSGPC